MSHEAILYIVGSISKLGTFMVLFALLYFLLKYTVCKLLLLNKHVLLKKIYLDDAVSIVISLLLILNFVSIYSPYLNIK